MFLEGTTVVSNFTLTSITLSLFSALNSRASTPLFSLSADIISENWLSIKIEQKEKRMTWVLKIQKHPQRLEEVVLMYSNNCDKDNLPTVLPQQEKKLNLRDFFSL